MNKLTILVALMLSFISASVQALPSGKSNNPDMVYSIDYIATKSMQGIVFARDTADPKDIYYYCDFVKFDVIFMGTILTPKVSISALSKLDRFSTLYWQKQQVHVTVVDNKKLSYYTYKIFDFKLENGREASFYCQKIQRVYFTFDTKNSKRINQRAWVIQHDATNRYFNRCGYYHHLAQVKMIERLIK